MVKSYLRHSALASLGLQARPVAIEQEPQERLYDVGARGQLALRGGDNNEYAPLAAAVNKVLVLSLPSQPCTACTGQGDDRILWLGPNEWLLTVRYGMQEGVETALRQQLSTLHHAITDVSHSRCIIGLSGTKAREILQKGCSLDLHPKAFGVDNCAQSHLGRCHILLHQITTEPCYELYIHRSFALYAYRWLEDAASEYRLTRAP